MGILCKINGTTCREKSSPDSKKIRYQTHLDLTIRLMLCKKNPSLELARFHLKKCFSNHNFVTTKNRLHCNRQGGQIFVQLQATWDCMHLTGLWEGSFSNLGLLGAEKQGMRLQDPTWEGQARAAT